MAENIDDKGIPLLLKPWISLYRSVPPIIKFPFTDVSMTFSICCSFYLWLWRLSFPYLLTYLGWPADHMDTVYASEALVGVAHSLHLCPILLVLLTTQPYSSVCRMSSHPLWWQQGAHAMMELCTGYMMYDCVCSLLWRNYQPGIGFVISTADWCFIGHHFATSLYMLSTRVKEAGHMGALAMMFLGESTNPAQNSLLTLDFAKGLGRECCFSVFMEEVLYPIVHFTYASSYAFVRIFLGPACTIDITIRSFFSKDGRANLPFALRVFMMIPLWGVNLGAIPWMIDAVDIVKSYLTSSSTTMAGEL